jgi:cell wall-associated NlpC family hydrolase
VRLQGRANAAALAAVSLLATGAVVVATPGVATASMVSIHYGQAVAGLSSRLGADGLVGPFVSRTGPARATQSVLGVDKNSVLSGQSIVFTGRLTTGAVQAPGAKQPVRLEAFSGGAWKTVGNALASNDGSVTFTVKPTGSTKYRLAYAGVLTLSPSVSAEQVVTVRVPVRSTGSSSSGSGSSSRPASATNIGSNGVAASATALAFVEAARAQSGKRYVYGTAGPDTFDCSGLVKYVAAQFGLSLPHNADAQKGYGTPVSAADAAPGDLIFFLDGGYAYHMGIYAGNGQMIDAPNSRTTVGLHTIWSSNVVFRRIF